MCSNSSKVYADFFESKTLRQQRITRRQATRANDSKKRLLPESDTVWWNTNTTGLPSYKHSPMLTETRHTGTQTQPFIVLCQLGSLRHLQQYTTAASHQPTLRARHLNKPCDSCLRPSSELYVPGRMLIYEEHGDDAKGTTFVAFAKHLHFDQANLSSTINSLYRKQSLASLKTLRQHLIINYCSGASAHFSLSRLAHILS